MNRFLPMALLGLLATVASGDTPASGILDRTRIKAYFHFPLSTASGIQGGFLEIVRCETTGECVETITEIRLTDLKVKGALTLSWEQSRLLLNLTRESSPPLTIAQSAFSGHWFPRVELCQGPQTVCSYDIVANANTQDLTLTIGTRKEAQ